MVDVADLAIRARTQGVTKANREIKQTTAVSKGASTAVKALGSAFAGLSAIQAGRFIRNSIRSTAQISEMADVAQISAERMQELTKAFSDLSGVSESITQGGLRRFARRLDLARQGTGAASDTLDQLNINLEQNTESALNAVIDRLQEMSKTQSITGAASQIFGEDAGPKMAAALAQGEDALRRQIRQLIEHGRILENETAEGARAANDAIEVFTDQLNTEFNRAVAQNSEEIEDFAKAAGGLASGFIELTSAAVEFKTQMDELGITEFFETIVKNGVPALKLWDAALNELKGSLGDTNEELADPAAGNSFSVIGELGNQTRDFAEEVEPAYENLRTLNEEFENLQAVADARSMELLAQQIEDIRRTVDPTRAGLLELSDNLDALSRSDLPTAQVEQLKIGLIDAADGGSRLVEAFDAVEDAADDRIRELGNTVVGAVKTVDDELEKTVNKRIEELGNGFERQAKRIGDSLADALMSGDFEGVGNAIASSIGGALGDSVTSSVSGALFESLGGAASSAIGGAAGGIVGGIAGQLVGDIIGGGSKEITRQINLAIEDAIVTGFEQVTIETSGLLGGTKKIFNELGLEITEAVENSFQRSTRDIKSALDSIGVDYEQSVQDFEFSLKDTNPSEFIKEASDEFLRESTVVAEVYREAGETMVDAINRIADDVKLATDALDVAEVDIPDFVGDLAAQIRGNISDGIRDLRDEKQSLRDEIEDIRNAPNNRKGKDALAEPGRREREINRIEEDIADLTSKISDQNDQLGEVGNIAKGALSQELIASVSEFSNVSTDQAKRNISGLTGALEDLRFSETEQAQRTIDDARESLERFGEIGIDASAPLEQIKQQIQDFAPETAEETAALLVASGHVESLSSAAEKLSESAGDAADSAARSAAEQRKIDQARDSRGQFLLRDADATSRAFELNQQLDIPLLGSTSALNDFVQSLDLTTESGRDALAQARELAPALKEMAEAEKQAQQAAQQAAQQGVEAAFSTVERASQTLGGALNSQISELESRQEQLNRNVADARDEVEQARERALERQTDKLNDTALTARDAAETWRSVVSDLEGVRRDLMTSSARDTGAAIRQQFEASLQAVFRGDAEAAQRLGSQATSLAEQERLGAGSQFEARTAVATIQRQLGDAESIAGNRISDAERRLENAQSQLESLKGTEETALTIAEAQQQLDQAQAARDNANLESQIQKLETERESLSLIDRDVTLSEARERFNAAKITLDRSWKESQEILLGVQNDRLTEIRSAIGDINGVGSGGPELASGGVVSGPSSGYGATLHGTEAVIPLNGGSVPVNVNNDELVREVRALRQETRAVGAQQTEQAKKTAKLLRKFDIDGLLTRSA